MGPLTLGDLPWSWNPWILASLIVSTALFARGLSRMDGVIRARLVGPLRQASFAFGRGKLAEVHDQTRLQFAVIPFPHISLQ
jgi:hypothetical protein